MTLSASALLATGAPSARYCSHHSKTRPLLLFGEDHNNSWVTTWRLLITSGISVKVNKPTPLELLSSSVGRWATEARRW
ncbi:hypothetical protein BHM03_00007906 [Ensete ventricosum]|uniref:Uncharacterized protein n=1 Tax=Ensete ventricosum TaxID=4639 RepID=A0A445MC62_ENSVE|nr:hypothetical protein BHM03_00007906 [Ensete ventricosum]